MCMATRIYIYVFRARLSTTLLSCLHVSGMYETRRFFLTITATGEEREAVMSFSRWYRVRKSGRLRKQVNVNIVYVHASSAFSAPLVNDIMAQHTREHQTHQVGKRNCDNRTEYIYTVYVYIYCSLLARSDQGCWRSSRVSDWRQKRWRPSL